MANELIKDFKIYGNQNVDYYHVISGVASTSFINSTYAAGYIPTFTSSPSTLLLANFTDTLEAGNILDLPAELTSFKIFRQEGDVLYFVAQVDASITSLTDYMVGNQNSYQYLVFAETDTLASQAITSNVVDTEWWDWSLTSYIESDQDGVYIADETWLFDIDLSSAPLNFNLDRYVYKNFTQLPKVSTGLNNYYTGSITARIGSINCSTSEYDYDTQSIRDSFRSFISSGKPYLIKDRKGAVIPVQIMNSSFANDDILREQITRITISFIQIDTANEVSVVNESALGV